MLDKPVTRGTILTDVSLVEIKKKQLLTEELTNGYTHTLVAAHSMVDLLSVYQHAKQYYVAVVTKINTLHCTEQFS